MPEILPTSSVPPGHAKKGIVQKLLYAARDLRSRAIFRELKKYCRGQVLDVGGFDFFLTAREKGVPFDHWTTIEPAGETMPPIDDPKFTFMIGDGCDMHGIPSGSFDTVLSMQVVEHVFEPIRMVEEIGRVLKPGGVAIFLIPQTSTLHAAPHHYYNFTRYWIEKAMARAQLTVVHFEALGGRWSSTASHLVYFPLQAFRSQGMFVPQERRGTLFYVLLPFMLLASVIFLPVCLLLSLGDLKEEPNNHLVVVRKPGA